MFIQNLKRLGISVNIDVVDINRYEYMVDNRLYDMITNQYAIAYPPGSEQENFWHSKNANKVGSQNWAGVENTAIDNLTEKLSQAKSIKEITFLARALDRVIMWEYYTIPQFYADTDNIIYDKSLKKAKIEPYIVHDIFSWWVE